MSIDTKRFLIYLAIAFWIAFTPALVVGGIVAIWWPNAGWTIFGILWGFLFGELVIRHPKFDWTNSR